MSFYDTNDKYDKRWEAQRGYVVNVVSVVAQR
jgi:hypothetical protein